ncbi:Rad51-domain-containing protein [Filobasidium floriforme]|uniref:Rad51-domain-containing protein n=1 Tax=Filobasidium floriforme TaxID=5210 RepID=UPI001E8E51B8|nr:Rad51-domain-containing protein [Filobasidium floriforme]KAH8082282.1 Rad51-domain-containing protein [Filobasidium floriforme]
MLTDRGGGISQEAVSGFESVDELQSQGINVQDINKLKATGICTILSVSQTTRRNLLKIKGLSEAKVEKLKEAAAKMLPPTFATAAEIGLRRECCVMITTGSKTVDAMLGGGIQTGSLTEVFGEYRDTQLPLEMGGGGGKVAWIDTEGTFRPERLNAICDRFGVDTTAATGNVICGRAYSSEQQHDMLFELAQRFVEDRTFKLLVIDSVMNLFRSDFSGRGELSERQQKLNAFLSRLAKMAEEFNIAVLMTNQVQADPGATAIFAGPSAKPIGGHILAHASATRIQLRKGRGEERIAKLVDSPCQPDGESTYALRVG